MKLCITKPQYVYAHWKARRAFADYPLYDVPNKKPERRLGEKKVQENFDYFMRVKDERLAYMIDWLQREFSVTVSLTPEGAYALDRWIDKYAGGLVHVTKNELSEVFELYKFDWRNQFNICNLIIDLGIFIGE